MADTETLLPTMRSVVASVDDPGGARTLIIERGDAPVPEPGQFHMLWVPGVGEAPISTSGVDENGVRHTVRAVGATTRALVDLRPGDEVGVRGPFGRGWDLAALTDRHLLVVAGGLGLAPLAPVLDLAATGALPAASVRVVVGTRTPGAAVLADRLRGPWSALDVRRTVDSADGSASGTRWDGAVGPVTTLLHLDAADVAHTTALVCGPELMMLVVARALVASGVDPGHVQLSVERTMHCGFGRCGHCQLGPLFVCTDGPVVTWRRAGHHLGVRER